MGNTPFFLVFDRDQNSIRVARHTICFCNCIFVVVIETVFVLIGIMVITQIVLLLGWVVDDVSAVS